MAVPVRKGGISDRRGSTESRPTEVVLRQQVDIDLGGALDNASLDHPCVLKLSRIAFNHRMDRGIGRARLRPSRGGPCHICPAGYTLPGPAHHGWDAAVSQVSEPAAPPTEPGIFMPTQTTRAYESDAESFGGSNDDGADAAPWTGPWSTSPGTWSKESDSAGLPSPPDWSRPTPTKHEQSL